MICPYVALTIAKWLMIVIYLKHMFVKLFVLREYFQHFEKK